MKDLILKGVVTPRHWTDLHYNTEKLEHVSIYNLVKVCEKQGVALSLKQLAVSVKVIVRDHAQRLEKILDRELLAA